MAEAIFSHICTYQDFFPQSRFNWEPKEFVIACLGFSIVSINLNKYISFQNHASIGAIVL